MAHLHPAQNKENWHINSQLFVTECIQLTIACGPQLTIVALTHKCV